MNEKRLIDANAVIRHFSNLERENEDALFTYEDIKKIIRNFPTDTTNIDAKLYALNPSDSDIIVAVVDIERFSVKEIKQISDVIREKVRNANVIFTTKDIEFTLRDKSELLSELQTIIDQIKQEVHDHDER